LPSVHADCEAPALFHHIIVHQISDDIKFEVSYGVDTPVQDWFGEPFTVNCEPDPQGEFSVTITADVQ